ncbi:MAG: hypothetical protein AB1304_03505 [Bacteroidota bacterium]
MSLPINIHELITGQVVEWERIEFKESFNPESVLKTIFFIQMKSNLI